MYTEGTVSVDHHQFVLGESDVDYLQTVAHGTLLDAGPGFVSFYTGIAYGPARIVVRVLDEEPAGLDTASWEVVEESSIAAASEIVVHATDGTVAGLAPVPAGTYRVRAHGRGRDRHYGEEVTEPVEDYLVELWAVPAAASSVETLHKTDAAWSPRTEINESSLSSDYVFVCDDSGAVVKVAPQSPEAQAVRKKLKEFGGRPLSPTLEAVFSSRYVAGLDRELVDKIDNATPERQQAFARWCVRRACERAGIAHIDWLAEVLDDMDAGKPADSRFIASFEARNRLDEDPRITRTIGTGLPASGEVIPQYEALHAYSFSMYEGIAPLEAAIEAFWHAASTYGMDYRELTTAAHRDFFDHT
ncbi:hypothetical protein [Prescottella subtropica]|uniref:hypothetical protein n=1 Tax=Prescottella subtropica TaxID=2545757 RepID=UPI0010F94F77|nr:hypothetical protein [Prescottella subtropica]